MRKLLTAGLVAVAVATTAGVAKAETTTGISQVQANIGNFYNKLPVRIGFGVMYETMDDISSDIGGGTIVSFSDTSGYGVELHVETKPVHFKSFGFSLVGRYSKEFCKADRNVTYSDGTVVEGNAYLEYSEKTLGLKVQYKSVFIEAGKGNGDGRLIDPDYQIDGTYDYDVGYVQAGIMLNNHIGISYMVESDSITNTIKYHDTHKVMLTYTF